MQYGFWDETIGGEAERNVGIGIKLRFSVEDREVHHSVRQDFHHVLPSRA